MDKRVLIGPEPERLEAELRGQFAGLDLLLWRTQDADGMFSVSAVPAHQVYELIEAMALKICRVIDRYSQVRVRPEQDEPARALVIIRSRQPALFIGRHGQTLDAIEFILNLVVSQRVGLRVQLTADIDQYRKKRMGFLDALMRRMVREIEQDHRERPLPGLLPRERRHVHTQLSNHPYLTTESRGRGHRRTLYILPRKDFDAAGGLNERR